MSLDDVPVEPADAAALARALLANSAAQAGREGDGRPRRYLVALAGIPGSGKSTFSAAVLHHLNASGPSAPPAVVLPMDGFHRTLAELAADADPELSFRRRGAPFTFAPDKLLDVVRRIRTEQRVPAPAFSHAEKDPVEGAVAVEPHHDIVIVEGNYLLLDEPVWRDISREMDERWFYSVPEGVALSRIIKRHVQAGLAPDERAAEEKALANDVLNGQHILANMLKPDRVLVEVGAAVS